MICKKCGFPVAPLPRRFRDEREICVYCENYKVLLWYESHPGLLALSAFALGTLAGILMMM